MTLPPVLCTAALTADVDVLSPIVHDYRRLALPVFKKTVLDKSVFITYSAFGIHESIKGSAKYCTVLREPVDRLVSFYYWCKMHEGLGVLHILANKLTLAEFVRRAIPENLLTAKISGQIGDAFRNDTSALDKAIDNIKQHYKYIGTLENINNLIMRMHKDYGSSIESVPWEHNNKKNRKNVNDIDEDTLNVLHNNLYLDRKLYQYVKSIEGVHNRYNNDCSEEVG